MCIRDRGNGILNTIFDGYAEYKGDIAYRQTGSLIAFEAGESITYGLFNAQAVSYTHLEA